MLLLFCHDLRYFLQVTTQLKELNVLRAQLGLVLGPVCADLQRLVDALSDLMVQENPTKWLLQQKRLLILCQTPMRVE